jgi:hypothetical protein
MRNPFSFRSWWRYLGFKADASPRIRFWVYERALRVRDARFFFLMWLADNTVDMYRRYQEATNYGIITSWSAKLI